MRSIAATILAAALAGASPSARSAEPRKVRLEIDTSSLPTSTATNSLTRWLAQDQTGMILDGGLEVTLDAPTAIRIVITRYGEQDANYRATIALVEVENEVVHEERVITCEMCTDGQLITKVGPEVARLAARVLYAPIEVEDAPAEPQAEPQVPQEVQEPEPSAEPEPLPQTTPQADPPPEPIGALGAVGIASAATGLGVTIAGLGLAFTPARWRLVEGTVEYRDPRSPGLALVGVGSALLVSGAVLVAVDVTRRRKARRLAIVPVLTGTSASVSLSTRF